MKDSKIDILKKFVIIFTIGCIVGTYHEQILHMFKYYFKTGIWEWEARTGLLYGPFSPIYGAGAGLIYLLFCLKERKWYQNFLYGALAGGILEYAAGFMQETLWGTISWDYRGYFLNINGRTTIPYMVIWGLVVLAFVYWIYPFINKYYEKIPKNITSYIVYPLIVFFVFDISISFIAVTRQRLRNDGIPPMTFIGELCDKYYTDERIRESFTNTRKPKR